MGKKGQVMRRRYDNAREVEDYIGKSHAFMQQLESILGEDYFKFVVRALFKNYETVNSDQFKSVILQNWDY